MEELDIYSSFNTLFVSIAVKESLISISNDFLVVEKEQINLICMY